MKTIKLKKDTPVKFRGKPMQPDNLKNFMTEWSTSQAEANHVETIEEANDFKIPDDDSEDFLQNVTVYEMHEMAEDNLVLLQETEAMVAESNETGVTGEDTIPHDQSAPNEQPNSLPETASLHVQTAKARTESATAPPYLKPNIQN